MKTGLIQICLVALGFAAAGCNKDLKSTRKFQLPTGDPVKGKAAFVALGCQACHPVAGVDLPSPTADPDLIVTLGGEVVRVRTYGDLLTSIIHPNFSLSPKLSREERRKMIMSPMPALNDVMTVTQLIDLVAFLQPRYRQLESLYEFNYQLVP